jgi:hypothetical protein
VVPTPHGAVYVFSVDSPTHTLNQYIQRLTARTASDWGGEYHETKVDRPDWGNANPQRIDVFFAPNKEALEYLDPTG